MKKYRVFMEILAAETLEVEAINPEEAFLVAIQNSEYSEDDHKHVLVEAKEL